MPSSFDSTPLHQLESEHDGPSSDDFFVTVSRLYCHYKAHDLKIRGARQARCREIVEEPLDLMLSVELINKRVLTAREAALFNVYAQHGAEALEKLFPYNAKLRLHSEYRSIVQSFPRLFLQAWASWLRAERAAMRRAKREAEVKAKAQAEREAQEALRRAQELLDPANNAFDNATLFDSEVA